MKKFLALMLACIMVLSLAACGSSAETAETAGAASEASTTAAATQAAETTKAQAAAETLGAADTVEVKAEDVKDKNWLCDEKTTLTVLTYDGVNNTFPQPSNDLEFWQYMEDYTNVHIEWEIVPKAGYPEVMSTRLASGADLADIVMTDDFTAALNAGKNGLFVDFNKYWDTCFPNIEKYYSEQGQDYRATLKNEDGSFYSVVGTRSPVEGHIIYMYNTDWMEKLGLEIPTTLDEFTNVLYKMQEAGDLNGNGEADEIVFTSTGFRDLNGIFANTYDIYAYEDWDQFAVDENGTVYPEYTTDGQKEMLKYLNKLYTDGILDPEIGTMSADMLSEKVAADRVGVFVYYSAFAITYGKLTQKGQADNLAEVYTLGLPLASEYNNNEAFLVRCETGNTCPTSVSADSENIELACKWLDVLIADPNVLLTRTMGFEGVSYKVNENGERELIYPEDGTQWNISKYGCGQIALPYIQTKEQLLNSKRQYTWYMDQYDYIRDNVDFRSPQIPQVNAFTDAEQEKLDEVKTDCSDYFMEMRAKFVTGAADIDKEWDSYVENLKKLGLDTWTEVWQSVYERTR